MRVFVTGGTGFVGSRLVEALVAGGHEVSVLTRNVRRAARHLPAGARAVAWDAGRQWYHAVAAADAVVNLAGENLAAGRWTPARKERILGSRVEVTRELVAALGRAGRRPPVLISASAVGYYGPTGAAPVTEEDPPGADFLARVCREWELAALKARNWGARVVLLRLGVVLGRGGALGRLLLPFRLYLGGPLGNGRQPFPWVHREDVVGLVEWALANPAVQGPVNAVAPEQHTYASMARTLGQVLGRPSWLPAPGWALRLALGEMADAMLLQGQAVVPAVAQALGYRFRYPELAAALRAILD